MEVAFSNAPRVIFGRINHTGFDMSIYSSEMMSKTNLLALGFCLFWRTFSITTEPSKPAFSEMRFIGISRALRIVIHTGLSASSLSILRSSREATAFKRGTHHHRGQYLLPLPRGGRKSVFHTSFFSFNSVSVAAPTRMMATPPESLARRSCNFSRS